MMYVSQQLMKQWQKQEKIWRWLCMETLRQRREAEVKRQQERNKKDLLRVAGYIITLVAWALCVAGFTDYIAGGW
jgi:hypothetical protein